MRLKLINRYFFSRIHIWARCGPLRAQPVNLAKENSTYGNTYGNQPNYTKNAKKIKVPNRPKTQEKKKWKTKFNFFSHRPTEATFTGTFNTFPFQYSHVPFHKQPLPNDLSDMAKTSKKRFLKEKNQENIFKILVVIYFKWILTNHQLQIWAIKAVSLKWIQFP